MAERNSLGQHNWKGVLACMAFLGLAACSQSGVMFSARPGPSTDAARVYVYRPEAHALAKGNAIIIVDGVKTTTLRNNGYALIPLSPGPHIITETWDMGFAGNKHLENKPISLKMDLAGGETAYVKLTSSADGTPIYDGIYMDFQWKLVRIRPQEAMPELRLCRRSDLLAGAP